VQPGGVKIARCYIMHINKEFTRNGETNPMTFLTGRHNGDMGNTPA
jgi:hypothetical protein